MTDLDLSRQLDIFSPTDLRHPVTVIGCGGIGSPTVMTLAKMGITDITVYDHDTVEAHNLPNQYFRVQDVGKPKVQAIKEICSEFASADIKVKQRKVGGAARLSGLVISGVDSMAARFEIWKAIKYKTQIPLYIDARMGGEGARIVTCRPYDIDQVAIYEAMLHPDEEAVALPCTGRAIIYNTFSIAALIGNLVKRFTRGEPISQEIVFEYPEYMLRVS